MFEPGLVESLVNGNIILLNYAQHRLTVTKNTLLGDG